MIVADQQKRLAQAPDGDYYITSVVTLFDNEEGQRLAEYICGISGPHPRWSLYRGDGALRSDWREFPPINLRGTAHDDWSDVESWRIVAR